MTRSLNINSIVKKLEDDILSPGKVAILEESKLIKSAVMSVVSKYFDFLIQTNRRRYGAEDNRIMNMALTSE